MKPLADAGLSSLALSFVAILSSPVLASGLATCESGEQSGWQPQAKLEKQLLEQNWLVRKIKIDGGCYEVYATDEKGQRVEAYFHPVTLEPVPTSKSTMTTPPPTPLMTTPPAMKR